MRSNATPQALSPAARLRWTRLGTLAALALLLGYLESFVPIPIPGVKLGLANIPVLVALAEDDLPGAFFIGLIKVGVTALLFGNPVSLAYSTAGTLLAFALMAPLSRLKTMRLEMVSIVGALAHEAGQLLVAQALLGTPLVWYSAPILAIAGCVTGLLCGITARRVAERLETVEVAIAAGSPTPGTPTAGSPTTGDPTINGSPTPGTSIATGSPTPDSPTATASSPTPGTSTAATDSPALGSPTIRDIAALVTYLALVVLFMRHQSMTILGLCLIQAIGLCLLGQANPRTLLRSLAPTLPMAIIALIAQIACGQQGEALLTVGPVIVTKEALASAGIMLMRLVGITCASVALVALAGRDGLARIGHAALAPIRRLGLPTAGPELAISRTLQLLPVLADRLQSSTRTVSNPLSLSFWATEIPDFAAELLESAGEDPSQD